MRGTSLASAVTFTMLSLSTAANACSCVDESRDLKSALVAARDGANAIYFARVLSTDGKPFGGFAMAEVLDVFKGAVTPGQRLSLPTGGGGDCTWPFKAGRTYLMYADGDSPTGVFWCSRTREAAADDLEITWLKSGLLPPLPVALQREIVDCRPCSFSNAIDTLLERRRREDDCYADLKPDEALDAAAHGRTFVVEGREGSWEDPWIAIGISKGSRAFKLVASTPEWKGESCRAKVVRAWCARLELSFPRFGGRVG